MMVWRNFIHQFEPAADHADAAVQTETHSEPLRRELGEHLLNDLDFGTW
jgi:hypothetical protein